MSLKIDLKALAKNAVKKATGKTIAVNILAINRSSPAYQKQKSNLEEGSFCIGLPDIGMEVRSIMFQIKSDKRVRLIMPSFAYPEPKEEGKKQKKIPVTSFAFTDPEVWQNVSDEMRKLLLENYEQRQSEEGQKDLSVESKTINKSASLNKVLTVELLELYQEEKDPDKKTLEEGTLKANLPDLGVEIRNIVYRIYEEKNIVILAPSRNRTRKKKKVAISDFVFTDEAVWLSILKNLRKQIVKAISKRDEAAKIPNEREHS